MTEKLKTFIEAANAGDISSLKRLIDAGVNVNGKDASGNQALHFAAINGKNNVIATLLDTRKVCINSEGFNKYTALHYATASKQLSTIEFLVERNADCNAVDENNETPLHFAFRRFGQCNHQNNTCILIKDLSDCVQIRKFFYRQCGKFSFDCVMSAVAEYFIKKGKADLFLLNNDNETPLSLIRNIRTDSRALLSFFEKTFEHSKLYTSLNQIQSSIQLLHLSLPESEEDNTLLSVDQKINSLSSKVDELSGALKRKESDANSHKIGNEEIETLKRRIEYLESHLCCNACKDRMKTMRFLCGHELCDECYDKSDGNCGLCDATN